LSLMIFPENFTTVNCFIVFYWVLVLILRQYFYFVKVNLWGEGWCFSGGVEFMFIILFVSFFGYFIVCVLIITL
jgi:hypothetical protein